MDSEQDTLRDGLMDEIREAIRRRVASPMIVVARVNEAITSVSVSVPGAKRPRIFYISVEEHL